MKNWEKDKLMDIRIELEVLIEHLDNDIKESELQTVHLIELRNRTSMILKFIEDVNKNDQQ